MKKVFIIVGFIIIVGVVGYLLYFLFFKPTVTPPPSGEVTEKEVGGQLPKAGEGKIKEGVTGGVSTLPSGEKATEEAQNKVYETKYPGVEISPVAKGGLTRVAPLVTKAVLGSILTSDNNLKFYDKSEGKFYQVYPSGAKSLLSEKSFYEVENVSWSPKGNAAILEYPDGVKTFYDFEKDKQYTLSENWSDFSFNLSGDKIAFKSDDSSASNRWLAVSRPDGTSAQAVEPMGENADKVIVSWSPNNQIVAFSRTGEPRGMWEQEIYPIGLHGENFRSLIVKGQGFESKWSPTGDKLLYSVYSSDSDYKPVLWITKCQGDDIGLNNISLKINTWAEKCAFLSDESGLYCSVPRQSERGSGLFPETSQVIPDDFYKIDLLTGVRSLVAIPSQNISAWDLFLSSDGKYLYFTDKMSGLAQRIELK